ncbi:MAG: RNA 2',3'-cyclic phosphodiesterase [Rhodobacteraceae bacterium CG17_big_fil_post_rev_8_21_14_2_50_65_11]|nr:MAG: RNA 2',3'-cyclic phosphodiesterase [Rhodobacteraceae bacterium CG17_big_fil_post_rev_8_21_14_2_50_65_11]
MRAFLSLDVPEDLRNPLCAMIGGLRAGRAVPRETLHLTLSFLGDPSEEQLEELHGTLETLHAPAPELRVGGLDWFGPGTARILAAIVEPVPELVSLQAEVERRARKLGLTPERRPFRPHVTLVRFRRQIPPEESAALRRFLANPPLVRVPVQRAPEVSLQASTLSKDGARYDTLAAYTLAE